MSKISTLNKGPYIIFLLLNLFLALKQTEIRAKLPQLIERFSRLKHRKDRKS